MAQENNNPRLPIISQNVNLLEVENTSNAFALVLAFYFQYRRSFLISSNCNTALNKIALKYGKTDGQQLLKDLFAKYRLPVPTSCSYSFCMKILSIFNIPNSYRQLLPSCFHENIEADQWKYDAELDVTSKIFDAEQVFTQKKIFTSLNSKMIYDNLSKVAHLIPGNQVGNRFDIQVAQEKLLAKKAYKEENQVIDELKHLHPLQLTIKIALSYYKDKSTHDKSHPDGKGPLCMLAQCVENRSRIQVVIRKRKGIHGILRGFIRGFDVHWNLYMTDVDEEYVPLISRHSVTPLLCNQTKDIKMSQGVLKRHLPSLLVRGDLVVVINKMR